MLRTWNAGEDVEQSELSYIACGRVNGKAGSPTKKLNIYFPGDTATLILGIYLREFKDICTKVLYKNLYKNPYS